MKILMKMMDVNTIQQCARLFKVVRYVDSKMKSINKEMIQLGEINEMSEMKQSTIATHDINDINLNSNGNMINNYSNATGNTSSAHSPHSLHSLHSLNIPRSQKKNASKRRSSNYTNSSSNNSRNSKNSNSGRRRRSESSIRSGGSGRSGLQLGINWSENISFNTWRGMITNMLSPTIIQSFNDHETGIKLLTNKQDYKETKVIVDLLHDPNRMHQLFCKLANSKNMYNNNIKHVKKMKMSKRVFMTLGQFVSIISKLQSQLMSNNLKKYLFQVITKLQPSLVNINSIHPTLFAWWCI